MPKKVKAIEGDPCTLEDGTEGELKPDDEGTLVCVPKVAEKPEPEKTKGKISDQMDRKTKTIELPSGKTAEVKEYINARERNELRSIFLGAFTLKPDDQKPEINAITGDLVDRAEKKRIELGVVSYDGNAENILDRILDGTSADYDFLLTELNKLDTGGFQTAK